LSFGRKGKSDDKNNRAGQAHNLFLLCKLLHPVSLCLRVFVLSNGINFADRGATGSSCAVPPSFYTTIRTESVSASLMKNQPSTIDCGQA